MVREIYVLLITLSDKKTLWNNKLFVLLILIGKTSKILFSYSHKSKCNRLRLVALNVTWASCPDCYPYILTSTNPGQRFFG